MILGTVNLRLTPRQTAALRKLWKDCAEGRNTRCTVVANVTLKAGQYFLHPATAQFHVFESKLGEPIQPEMAPANGGMA